MSETTETGVQEHAAAPPKSKAMITVAVAAVALLAGVGGGIVLAPRLLPAAAAGAEAGEHETKEEEGEGEEAKEGHGGASGKIFKLDNIIVNPAGSEGSRFLMASVAFEVEDEVVEAKLRDHELRLRDLAVGVLESQSMASLTQPFVRDSIKRRLMTVIVPIVGPKAKVRVYLPQFVIQ